MSDKIEVGDLVVVVRWPCCKEWLGKIFRVGRINQEPPTFCTKCKALHGSVYAAIERSDTFASPITWLRKIPPLAELESVERETELCR